MPRTSDQPIDQNKAIKGKTADDIVPISAVYLTPAEEDDNEYGSYEN